MGINLFNKESRWSGPKYVFAQSIMIQEFQFESKLLLSWLNLFLKLNFCFLVEMMFGLAYQLFTHLGPDHVQLTLLNWDNESVLAVNEKHFHFLFRAKTLLVSQLSKVHCRWSGPICLAKKNAQCLLSILLTLQQSIKGEMPLSNVEV